MAIRVETSDLLALVPQSKHLSEESMNIAIESANLLVEELNDHCDEEFSEERLTKIELYLSAHFLAITNNQLAIESESNSCSKSSIKYSFKFGDGILGTQYGIAANSLAKGCLVDIDKPEAVFKSIGCL